MDVLAGYPGSLPRYGDTVLESSWLSGQLGWAASTAPHRMRSSVSECCAMQPVWLTLYNVDVRTDHW
jgi:hypothetical protein